MSRLEDALRESLRREDPGPEFTRRVLARAAESASRRSWWQRAADVFGPGMVRWAAACAVTCSLLVVGSLEYREHQRRVEGEQAKQKLILALRVAGTKLHMVQAKVTHRSY